ncbi:MAG: protein kinase [Bradymonadaceae bacterium]|nr:protein kinase [Lujinxingiaceae bacterium]
MAELPRLGPFELGQCIGRGGMGKVFRGVHATTGVAVAVKVILGNADRDARRNFHREVQAQAGLAHPGVVYLFDYGMVDEQTARTSGGELEAGSPYVVMELADRGSVSDHMPFGSWQDVRQVLAQVLEALAFAHAREVIHRDLKPENFLVFVTDTGERRVRLADFGLAHALGHGLERNEHSLTQLSGTRSYMAPEQFRGAWRTYGPWTDLYALGCVAWHLVCGKPPYDGSSLVAIAKKHFDGQVPPIQPLFTIPEGVEEWICTAMAADPRDRFQRAANAIDALPLALGIAERTNGQPGGEPGAETLMLKTSPVFKTLAQWPLESDAQAALADDSFALARTQEGGANRAAPTRSPPGHRHRRYPRPPLPAQWQTVQHTHLPGALIDAGLSLFGLREIPFVARATARDRIWSALHDVTERGELRVVLVAGEAGVGKSRLVDWMATRAHEVGAAELLKAVHSGAGGGPTEGFAGLVKRAFHAWKLSRSPLYDELLERLEPLDDEDSFREIDARALTELVHPSQDESSEIEGPRYRFTSAHQKYALIRRLLMRFARHRVPLLWLDDLHHSTEGLELVAFLLSLPKENRPAVLILGTLRADVLAENEELAQHVAGLVDHEHCQRIDLGAIDASDHRELIELMLPLCPELADILAERTEGNPLFAHQLLSYWINAQSVTLGEQGLRVGDGQSLALPDDVHELWMARIDRYLERFPRDEAQLIEEAIELAAALGREVDRDEWQALSAQDGRALPVGVDDALLKRGLAVRTASGWAFAHGLLVDSVERRARQAGRWQRHHRCCAQMLEARYPDHLKQTAQRRAGHWIEADELERALDPLLEASRHWFERGEKTQRKQTLRLHRELLDRLGRDRLAPQRLENDLNTSAVLFYDGKSEEVFACVEGVLSGGQQIGDVLLTLRAHERLASFLAAKGHAERAQREIQSALDLAIAAGDEYWQAKVMYRQGWMWFHVGELQKADQCLDRATALFHKVASLYDELQSDAWRGWVQLSREQYQQAAETFEAVLEQTREQGFRALASHCLNGLGDIARFKGDFIEARRFYEQVRQIDLELADTYAICRRRHGDEPRPGRARAG